MKLSEALILRADYQKRLLQLHNRLKNNAKVQEGEKPAENPTVLIQEYLQITEKLEKIIQQINRCNANKIFEGSQTISDAIASRDILAKKIILYRSIVEAASISHARVSRSEVKYISTVDVKAIQKQADDFAKQYRELDTKIQSINWETEIE